MTLYNHEIIGHRLFYQPFPCVCAPLPLTLELFCSMPRERLQPKLTFPLSMPRAFVEKMLADVLPETHVFLTHFRSLLPSPPSPPHPILPLPNTHIPGYPFRSLLDTTTGTVHGDLSARVHTYHFAAEKDKLSVEEVLALPPGQQIWDLAFFLDPGLHGKGVMSEAVGCMIEGWVGPWMGAGVVSAVSERVKSTLGAR